MRRYGTLLGLMAALLPVVASAGVPSPRVLGLRCFPNQQICPERCSFAVSASNGGCQYVMGVSALDPLNVRVTLRNGFDTPVAACSTTVTLIPNAGTVHFCSCCPVKRGAMTDAAGAISVDFDGLGGFGSLDVAVSAHCIGDVALFAQTIQFTSPDLGGSCEAEGSTGITDLGRWAAGLVSYAAEADYDCSGTINIIDLGYFAQGLGTGCDDAACP